MLTFRAAGRRLSAWLGFGDGGNAEASGPARRSADGPVRELPPDLVEPLVAPAYGIDGWTYQGTALEECFPPDIEVELAALAHAVSSGLATTWSYEQAARLLERHRVYGQAYAVVTAYLASGAPLTPSVARQRARLADAVLSQTSEPNDR